MKKLINFITLFTSLITLISYTLISIFLLLTEKYVLTFNIVSTFMNGNTVCWLLITCLISLLINWIVKEKNNILTMLTNLLTISTIYFIMSLFFTSPNDYGIVIQNKFFKITRIFTNEEKQEWLIRIKSSNLNEEVYKLITKDHLINSNNYIEFKNQVLSLSMKNNAWLEFITTNSFLIMISVSAGCYILYKIYTGSIINWFNFLTEQQLIHNKYLQDLAQTQLNLIQEVKKQEEIINTIIQFLKDNVGKNSTNSKNIDILFENIMRLTEDIVLLKTICEILKDYIKK